MLLAFLRLLQGHCQGLTHGQKFGISYSEDEENTYSSDASQPQRHDVVVTNPSLKPVGSDDGSNNTQELSEDLKVIHLSDNKDENDGNQGTHPVEDTS